MLIFFLLNAKSYEWTQAMWFDSSGNYSTPKSNFMFLMELEI